MRVVVLPLVLSIACVNVEPEPFIEAEPGVALQQLRGGATANGSFVAVDMLLTDDAGRPIPCEDMDVAVEVEVSYEGDAWTSVAAENLRVQCGDTSPRDVALVLDESGSQQDVVDQTMAGAGALADAILSQGGRVGVVSLASTVTVRSGLTSDGGEVHEAISELDATNGWTALYDGIRVGNEVLGSAITAEDEVEHDDLDSFCADHRSFSVVAYTNGDDNNSGDERTDPDRGDGIDTTLGDLQGLHVSSVPTPIHTIGLGDGVATEILESLAEATGAKHLAVTGESAVVDAFAQIAEYPDATTQVCASLDAVGCGLADVRVTYTLGGDGIDEQAVEEFTMHVPCPPEPPEGRSATILLTMSDINIDPALSQSLIGNTVDWVSPVPDPSILLLRDDNHHNEDLGDAAFVEDTLVEQGHAVTFMEEPAPGIELSDLEGYDVVWLQNPGWPIDDLSTFEALELFLAGGGGVVLQGDDVSWAMGRAFSMSPITHLDFVSNGVRTCDVRTDNNAGANYLVTFGTESHPMSRGLEGRSFEYGNDIDHTSRRNEGEDVLAWATLADDPACSTRVPVVVGFDP